jgi:ketosteroid isomerase-like protein
MCNAPYCSVRLADAHKTYRYALDIKEIIIAGDVAAVRLTWTLSVAPAGSDAQTTREEGLDLFRRQADGRWRLGASSRHACKGTDPG